VLRSVSPLRVLDDRDLSEARALLARDPVLNVMVASRVEASGLDPWRLGAEVWGWFAGSRLESLCYAGANFVPVAATPEAVRGFAERARRQGRRCSSIVGDAWTVGPLWSLLESAWGAAREVRPRQPVLVASRPAVDVPPDPYVRLVRPEELDILLPAAVAMFTEEVGVSPTTGDGGDLYRARVAELITHGRALAHIEDGRVLFKAEIGSVTSQACQVQGVWVDPELRGRGLGATGMAAVLEHALREIAPQVSLYVNDFNLSARAVYRKVGFSDAGTFMSVLF
jgi:predicted GNAT family acetyltransferase